MNDAPLTQRANATPLWVHAVRVGVLAAVAFSALLLASLVLGG